MGAADPQTDRELLLKLNSEIEKLAESINHFSTTLKDIEEKKIAALDKRIVVIEDWKSKMVGVGIVVIFLSGLITAGIVALFKALN